MASDEMVAVNAAVIVAVVLGVVIAGFFVWAWTMNRLDERREKRERHATHAYHRGLP